MKYGIWKTLDLAGLIYEATPGALKVFLKNVITEAMTYSERIKRKTVTGMMVV